MHYMKIYALNMQFSVQFWIHWSRINLVSLSPNYMSTPAGDIHCFSLRVCPSVRPPVRLSVTPSLSEPYLQEPFVQNICKKNPKIIYLLNLCNKKKFNFAKNFGCFGPKKKHFLNSLFMLSRPDLGNYKR